MSHNTEDLFYHIHSTSDAPPEGALNHLKIAIRPNVSVYGWPTRAGSKALENYRPAGDATVVKRLREQGVRMVGLSRMSELGLGVASDTAHLLVAEGHCDLFLGTDIAGETRFLSTLAGAWGFKPSIGICSNLGIINLVPSMECTAVIAENPAVIAEVLSVVSGKDDHDFSMLWETLPEFAPQGVKEERPPGRIGFLREQVNGLDREERLAFDRALAVLDGKGSAIEEISFPDCELFRSVHQIIGATEASSSAGKYAGVRYGHRAENAANWNEMYISSREEAFGELIKSFLFQGAWFQFRDYEAFEHACRIRSHLVKETRQVFEKVDFLASPVRRSAMNALHATTIPEIYDAFSLTLMANVTGCPSLCAPGIVKTGDLDLGFQLVAPHLSDVKLLDFATQYLSRADHKDNLRLSDMN